MEIESLVETVPGGTLTVAAVALLAMPGVRRQLRPAAKSIIGFGIVAFDKAKEMTAEARESTNDLIAEVRLEREQQQNSKDGQGDGSEQSA